MYLFKQIIEDGKEAYVYAFASDVLGVAICNPKYGDWAMYIGSVPGNTHKTEFIKVTHTGAKMDQNLAELIFPRLAEKYEWRD